MRLIHWFNNKLMTDRWPGWPLRTLPGEPINQFAAITVPLVHRIIPSLIAYEIAEVQPMAAPTGLIFSMKEATMGFMIDCDIRNSIEAIRDKLVDSGELTDDKEQRIKEILEILNARTV